MDSSIRSQSVSSDFHEQTPTIIVKADVLGPTRAVFSNRTVLGLLIEYPLKGKWSIELINRTAFENVFTEKLHYLQIAPSFKYYINSTTCNGFFSGSYIKYIHNKEKHYDNITHQTILDYQEDKIGIGIDLGYQKIFGKLAIEALAGLGVKKTVSQTIFVNNQFYTDDRIIEPDAHFIISIGIAF